MTCLVLALVIDANRPRRHPRYSWATGCIGRLIGSAVYRFQANQDSLRHSIAWRRLRPLLRSRPLPGRCLHRCPILHTISEGTPSP